MKLVILGSQGNVGRRLMEAMYANTGARSRALRIGWVAHYAAEAAAAEPQLQADY
jgi:hypothetical protein